MSARRHWQRVEELFAWAVEHDPASRSAELAARCAGDPVLCAEVDSLIAAWESSGDFLETPAPHRIARAGDENDPRRGARIGRYRLVRPIGRGGMGVVYEAWQDDPRRVVALKVVRGGALADPLRVRRFQREAESLGRLDHPGIARIFEAGLDQTSGDHWFAMELVRGRPLAEYVRVERPARATALQLFVGICQAVDHAHRQGVVHRDLKPSNVLVVSEAQDAPAVKVLDFGLAHCTAGASEEVTQLTEPGRVFGTLPYMSPEQARGEPGASGPGSDIYSLGVILYELLTGRLPLDVEGLPLPAAVRRISESVPERPGRIDRSLRGDLETIVLKALEKEPSRRYASAADLARDVERQRAGWPIAARPPSFAYQARKLVLRHRVFFGAALLSCLFFAAASVVSGVLYARARQAERRARVEGQAALEISAFLQEMLASAQPGGPNHELSVREVLDRAAEKLEREPVAAEEVGAALHATIGDAYRALGLYERAERHLEIALATHRADPAADSALAKDLSALGLVRLEQGRYAEAEALAREALAILRRAGPPHTLAEVLVQLGSALRLQAGSASALDEARALYEEALAIALDPATSDALLAADVLNKYGGALAAQGDNAGAERHYRRALELHRGSSGPVDLRVAEDENDLAIVLARGEQLKEAISLTRHALASYEQILGREHPTTVALMNNLGSLLVRGPELDEGEALLLEALAARRRLLGDAHPDVARTLSLLGHVARRRKELDGARECFTEALETYRARLGPFHVEVANNESSLALVELDAGDARAALPHARLAFEVYGRVLPADHVVLLQSQWLFGHVLFALGERAEAEPLLAGSLEALAKLRGDGDPATLPRSRTWPRSIKRTASPTRPSRSRRGCERLGAERPRADAPYAGSSCPWYNQSVRYLLGFLLLLAGLGVLWVCYHADEMGLGRYQGYGENHYLVALFGLLTMGAGLLLIIAPRRKGKGFPSGGAPHRGGITRNPRRRW